MIKYFLSALLLFFINSCNEPTQTDHPIESLSESKTIPTTQQEINTHVDDPSFVVPRDTISKYGPKSITRNILEDRKGNFWFATWEGIVCFDGNQFINFTLKERLRRFHIFSILEDKTGNLWFGTVGGGVYRYDGKSFTLFTMTEHLAGNKIFCMLEDKSGNIWFATDNGVSRFNGYTFTNYSKADGLSDNFVSTIAQDQTGKLWFGTNGGVSCFSSDVSFNNRNSFTNFTNEKAGTSFHNVRSILADKTGNIWIGSQEGLCRYNVDTDVITNLTTNFIGFIFEDKSGNIWLSEAVSGTPGMTLSRVDGRTITKIITKDASPNPFFTQIFGITEDRNGNIWFGTATGVCRYDGNSFTFLPIENINFTKNKILWQS